MFTMNCKCILSLLVTVVATCIPNCTTMYVPLQTTGLAEQENHVSTESFTRTQLSTEYTTETTNETPLPIATTNETPSTTGIPATHPESMTGKEIIINRSELRVLLLQVALLRKNVMVQFKKLTAGSSALTINSMFTDALAADRPQLPDDVVADALSCQHTRVVLEKSRNMFMMYYPWVDQQAIFTNDYIVHMYIHDVVAAFNTVLSSTSGAPIDLPPQDVTTTADLNEVLKTLVSLHVQCTEFISQIMRPYLKQCYV